MAIPSRLFRCPTFTEYDDGSITVDEWVAFTRITSCFIRLADSDYLKMTDDHVTITVSNGYARYKLLEYHADMDWWDCELVESAIDLPVRAE